MRKNRIKYRHWIVIAVLLTVVVAFYTVFRVRQTVNFGGPLLASTDIPSSEYMVNALGVKTGTRVVLGGYEFPLLKKNTRFLIESIKPLNLPKGLTVVGDGILKAAPDIAIGSDAWVRKTNHNHLIFLPTGISGTDSSMWIPIIIVEPTKSGTFIIQGLLVTYTSEGKRYTDYLRDTFVVCAGNRTNGVCPDLQNIPAPPVNP